MPLNVYHDLATLGVLILSVIGSIAVLRTGAGRRH
jgi:hypothetical protein